MFVEQLFRLNTAFREGFLSSASWVLAEGPRLVVLLFFTLVLRAAFPDLALFELCVLRVKFRILKELRARALLSLGRTLNRAIVKVRNLLVDLQLVSLLPMEVVVWRAWSLLRLKVETLDRSLLLAFLFNAFAWIFLLVRATHQEIFKIWNLEIMRIFKLILICLLWIAYAFNQSLNQEIPDVGFLQILFLWLLDVPWQCILGTIRAIIIYNKWRLELIKQLSLQQ